MKFLKNLELKFKCGFFLEKVYHMLLVDKYATKNIKKLITFVLFFFNRMKSEITVITKPRGLIMIACFKQNFYKLIKPASYHSKIEN